MEFEFRMWVSQALGADKTHELFVSVHRAPHLLCSRAFEVRKSTSAYPAPRIYGTLQTLAGRKRFVSFKN
jgi:hypothetical protein